MSLAIGKWRRLQQAASCQGTFSILAIDHRGPLRRALDKESPGIDVDEALSALKQDMARRSARCRRPCCLIPKRVPDSAWPAARWAETRR